MKTSDKPRMSWCSKTKMWYCEKHFGFTKISECGFTPERAFRNYERRLRRANIPFNERFK